MSRVRPLSRNRPLLMLLTLAAVTPAGALVHEVKVRDNVFVPSTVTVAAGDTVRWVWEQGHHTVTSGSNCVYDGQYFDAMVDPNNLVFEFVVPTGVSQIPYFCRPHCFFGMVGLIRVDPNAEDYLITLDGFQENPPVATTATGTGTATLYPLTNTLAWEISFSGLSSAQTAAHFHGPASPCQNAGIQVGLPNGSPIRGSAVLTVQQVTDLRLGRWYMNVHTTNFPGGEIRGRVAPVPLDDPIPAPIPLGDLTVRLQPIATGLTAPNWGAAAPGVPGRLFVTDQVGTLWNVDLATGNKSVFLNVSSRLVPLGISGPNSFDERGLLGVAFHPNYASNGLLYTYTSEPATGIPDFTTMPTGTTPNHQTVIAEWQVPNPTNPNSVVDPNSRRELLRIDQPQFNHNAGALNFGPDGRLYIALGDGGGRDDRDDGVALGVPIVGHGCQGNGANPGTILGSLLRIDPRGNNSANGRYGIPQDNPFVGQMGYVEEIYAYGFRNPFRFSFDSQTGDLYVGDVGQNDIEEVNLVTAGGNYGWRHKEGSFYFLFNGNQPGYVTDRVLDVPAGLIDPIAEYDHDDGISVIGGFVYRGSALPALAGRYVFGEFARTFNNNGRLFYLDAGNEVREFQIAGAEALSVSVLGFGRDANGELYVLVNSTGTPFGTTGAVLRIGRTVCRGDLNCDGFIDFGDINPFVLALSNFPAWKNQNPYCPEQNSDINGDGQYGGAQGFGDINPFVGLLSSGGGQPIPCP